MSRTGLLITSHDCQCGIDQATWHERLPNLIDYDFVILDTASLNQFCLERAKTSEDLLVIRKPQAIDRDLQRNLKLMKSKILEILRCQGRVFAIYEPSQIFYARGKKYTYSLGEADGWVEFIDTNAWCPIQVPVHEELGKRVQVNDDSYAPYLGMLDRWKYYFLTDKLDDSKLRQHYENLGLKVSLKVCPIATSKADQPLALSIRIDFRQASRSESRKAPSNLKPSGGELVLLPSGEDIETLVEHILQIAEPRVPTPAPTWIADVRLPGEDGILGELSLMRQKVQKVEVLLSERTKYKGLLYEGGRSLEDICREAFELLGASIKPSVVNDEFIIEVEGEQALVEVKGHARSVLLRDLSQLIRDVGNHLAETKQAIHGILVGNAWRFVPISERKTNKTPIFPDNVVRSAKNNGVGLLSTIELFQACCRVFEQPETKREILNALMKGKGIIKLH